MSSFSFSLAPETGGIAETVDDVFAIPVVGGVPAASSSSTAAVVVDGIRRPFLADPVRAVIDAVDPIDEPEDIARWDSSGRISRFIEHEEATRKRKEELSATPLYRFGETVDSLLNTGSGPTLQGVKVFLQPERPVYQNPNPRSSGEGTGDATRPAFRLDEHAVEADYQYGAAVNAVLNQPSTTGVVQLSADIRAGIESALVHLFSYDPVKFQDCNLDMFLKADHPLRLMASLVAACITTTRVQNPHDYRKDLDWPRSIESINTCVKRMSSQLARIEEGSGKQKKIFFVAEDPKRVLANKRLQALHGQGLTMVQPVALVRSTLGRMPSGGAGFVSIARRKY